MEERKTYRSDGTLYAEHELVEFDLKQAKILMNEDVYFNIKNLL